MMHLGYNNLSDFRSWVKRKIFPEANMGYGDMMVLLSHVDRRRTTQNLPANKKDPNGDCFRHVSKSKSNELSRRVMFPPKFGNSATAAHPESRAFGGRQSRRCNAIYGLPASAGIWK